MSALHRWPLGVRRVHARLEGRGGSTAGTRSTKLQTGTASSPNRCRPDKRARGPSVPTHNNDPAASATTARLHLMRSAGTSSPRRLKSVFSSSVKLQPRRRVWERRAIRPPDSVMLQSTLTPSSLEVEITHLHVFTTYGS